MAGPLDAVEFITEELPPEFKESFDEPKLALELSEALKNVGILGQKMADDGRRWRKIPAEDGDDCGCPEIGDEQFMAELPHECAGRGASAWEKPRGDVTGDVRELLS
eukprot:Skav225031  [mRNA]  locus=scaffold2061:160281:161568:+ [translate_table: standard]